MTSNRVAFLIAALAIVAFGACGNETRGDAASEREATSKPAASPLQPAAYEGLWRLREGTGPQGDVPVVKGWDVSDSGLLIVELEVDGATEFVAIQAEFLRDDDVVDKHIAQLGDRLGHFF